MSQLGLVAAADDQLCVAEERGADFDLALVALRGDHVDSRGRDRQVVDVGPAPGHSPVVKDDRVGTATSQKDGELFLACSAPRPSLLVLGRLFKPEQQISDPRVTLPRLTLTLRPPPFVLTPPAGTGGADVEVWLATHLSLIGALGDNLRERRSDFAGRAKRRRALLQREHVLDHHRRRSNHSGAVVERAPDDPQVTGRQRQRPLIDDPRIPASNCSWASATSPPMTITEGLKK